MNTARSKDEAKSNKQTSLLISHLPRPHLAPYHPRLRLILIRLRTLRPSDVGIRIVQMWSGGHVRRLGVDVSIAVAW